MTETWTYPLVRGETLATNDWVEWQLHRFLSSDFLTRIKYADAREAGFVAVELWTRSYLEDPAGTLPDDDVLLADRAGYGRDVEAWLRVRPLALYGWTPVLVEDAGVPVTGRLGHRAIAEIAVASFRRKDGRRQAREAARLAGVKHKVKAQFLAAGQRRLAENDDVTGRIALHLQTAGLWATAENVSHAAGLLFGITNVVNLGGARVKD